MVIGYRICRTRKAKVHMVERPMQRSICGKYQPTQLSYLECLHLSVLHTTMTPLLSTGCAGSMLLLYVTCLHVCFRLILCVHVNHVLNSDHNLIAKPQCPAFHDNTYYNIICLEIFMLTPTHLASDKQ